MKYLVKLVENIRVKLAVFTVLWQIQTLELTHFFPLNLTFKIVGRAKRAFLNSWCWPLTGSVRTFSVWFCTFIVCTWHYCPPSFVCSVYFHWTTILDFCDSHSAGKNKFPLNLIALCSLPHTLHIYSFCVNMNSCGSYFINTDTIKNFQSLIWQLKRKFSYFQWEQKWITTSLNMEKKSLWFKVLRTT